MSIVTVVNGTIFYPGQLPDGVTEIPLAFQFFPTPPTPRPVIVDSVIFERNPSVVRITGRVQGPPGTLDIVRGSVTYNYRYFGRLFATTSTTVEIVANDTTFTIRLPERQTPLAGDQTVSLVVTSC